MHLDTVLDADEEQVDRLFTLLLLTVIGIQLVLTLGFEHPESRLFPLVIGVPTFFFLLLLFLAQSSERLAESLGRFISSNVIDMDEIQDVPADDSDTSADNQQLGAVDRRKKFIRIALWILLFFGLVLIAGFLPSIFLFLALFYYIESRYALGRSLAVAAAIWLFSTVLFKYILRLRLYTGLLDVTLPIVG